MEMQETNEEMKKVIHDSIQLFKDINKYTKDMESLLKSTEIKRNYLQQLNNQKDKLKDKCEQLITQHDNINPMNLQEEFKVSKEGLKRLQEEVKDKDYEIEQLQVSLKELIDTNNEVVRKKGQARDEAKKELLKIDELNNRLEEIKDLILDQKRVKSTKPKYPAFIIQEKKRNNGQIDEIRRFIEPEKERLFIQKKALTENYDVSVKLLKSNQSNLDEWKNEISQHQIDETHSLIGNLKSGLDNQVNVLTQQIGRLK